MFNEELTLGDFVCPIAICQPEADLGSLLKIFQSNNSNLIAIFLEDKSLRTISSQTLLAQLGKFWQNQGFATVSHPRQLVNQENFSNPKIRDFKHLFEPANVYRAKIRLLDFLQNTEKVDFNQKSTEYLIIDEFGQLKGKLDQPKILRYLASIVNNVAPQVIRPTQKVKDFIRDFVDLIASPLKVETASGQSIYENRCWRELIAASSQEKVQPNAAIANWWIGQKTPIVKNNTDKVNQHQANGLSISCCSSILPANIEVIDGLEIFHTKPLPSFFSDHCAAANVLPKSISDETIIDPFLFSHLDIQIEKNQDWSQIKIPIALTSKGAEITANPDNLLYWLVFATKTNESFFTNYSSIENVATSEKIVTELISTISHELKSPLTGIIGLSSLLKDQQLGHLTQRQTLYTQLINNSGYKLMEIVNDLLELQGLMNSDVAVNVEHFNLLALFRHVYDQTCQKSRVNKVNESDQSLIDVQLELEIEPELEIVTTNKRNLAVILSHLFLEILQFVDSASGAVIVKITQDRNDIVIKINNDNSLSNSSIFTSVSSQPSSGWNLTLAKYLVRGIKGSIQSYVAQDNFQIILIFPSNNSSLPNTSFNKNVKPYNLPAKNTKSQPKNVTILCLYPEIDVLRSVQDTRSSLDFNLKNWAEKDWSNIGENPCEYQYRIIEADGLEQAHTLARIWKLDVIIIDGYQINEPKKYLQSLQQSSYLATLPLITLDTKTTEAANLVEGLKIYPCLLPNECRSINDLIQVIGIATGLKK